jgi:ankyrin repeat protein
MSTPAGAPAQRRTVAALCGLLIVAGCGGGEPRTEPNDAESTPTTRTEPEDSPTVPPRTTPQDTAEQPVLRRALTPREQAALDTRLIAAAWDDDVALARRLIDRGADVNTEDETEQSAFLIATSEGYLALLELTLRSGADVDAKDSFNGTGLIRAADRGHWDVAGRLVRAGVEIDHINNLGWTALHEAIILGDGSQRYLDTVRVLVAAGADVTIPSQRDGIRPVVHASSRGYADMADLLTRAEGVPPASDRALLAAASAGDADAVALALRTGADPDARDRRGRTPLALAIAADSPEVVRLLRALGG